MTRLLIFSDVHKNKERLVHILDRYSDLDYTISLGDSEMKSKFLEERDVVAIKGNATFDAGFTEEHVLMIEEVRVVLTHGHKYRVQNGIDKLYYRALECEAQLIFYGHTHSASYDVVENRLFVNPGSVNRSRSRDPETYLMIEAEKKTWKFQWLDAENHALLREISHEF